MSVRLKDRLAGIPYGFKFLVPQSKWVPAPWDSFDGVVKGLIYHLKGNPQIQKQLGWSSLDYNYVADKVDEYNAAICKAHGWNNFITEGVLGGSPIPKSSPRLSRVVQAAAVGANTIKEMFGSEGPVKDAKVAAWRAEHCLNCPKNDKTTSWESFFTVPASNLIRKALSIFKDLDLKTDLDPYLGTCTVCLCPLKLKVWARLDHILKHLPAEDKARLPQEQCWIILEEKAK